MAMWKSSVLSLICVIGLTGSFWGWQALRASTKRHQQRSLELSYLRKEKAENWSSNFSTVKDMFVLDRAQTRSQVEIGAKGLSILRELDMERTRSALLQEFATAGGNWKAWYDRLGAFRDEVRSSMSARPFPWDDGFVFSSYTRQYLDQDDFEHQEVEKAPLPTIVSISEQFRKRGIDVIFVPIPNAWDVYPDKASDKASFEERVHPPVSRLLLSLLAENVEVIDLWPHYRDARRDELAEWLYFPTDTHFTNRGLRVAAHQIACRLKRYAFPRLEEFTSKTFMTELPGNGNCFALVPTELRPRYYPEKIQTEVEQILTKEGKVYEDPMHSPILVIGDSYNEYFMDFIIRGGGLTAHIAKELGIPTARVTTGASTTEAFKRLFREHKELLKELKVIVWIVADFNLHNRPWPIITVPE